MEFMGHCDGTWLCMQINESLGLNITLPIIVFRSVRVAPNISQFRVINTSYTVRPRQTSFALGFEKDV